MGNTEIFDQMADRYDTEERILISNIITLEIRKHLEKTEQKKLLDFGCGTGLVGLSLCKDFESVIFVDSSQNMINFVNEKIKKDEIKNAIGNCVDLESESNMKDSFDYIIAAQVLLHIKDVDNILKKLYRILNSGGHLILVDFEKNPLVDSELVHNGFDVNLLKNKLIDLGFKNINSKDFYEEENLFMGKRATLFIMDGEK